MANNNNTTKSFHDTTIPSDWEILEMRAICNKITDGTHDTPTPTEQGVPFLTAIHVKEDLIDFENCYFLPESIHKEIYRRCNPEKDDVLMVNIGAGVATTALVNVDYEFSLKNVALLKPNRKKVIGSYLNYYQVFIKPKLTQSLLNGGAQPFLSLKQIQKLKVTLPPIPEQKAIAKVLGLMDCAINANNQLISQKELRKKWLMQNLLTGKKRLNGFGGKWKVHKLGKLADIKKGKQLNKLELEKEGDYPAINGGISPSGYTYEWNTEANTITISEGGNSCGFINFITTRFWSGGYCYSLLNLKNIIGKEFLFQTLKYNEIKIMKLRVGSGLPNIQMKSISDFKLEIPPIVEQTAIAQLLQAADKEMQLLKTKTEKLKEQKKGMMQMLLTGKKRLKI